MKKSFMPYRDELFISTKAGHDMWPGPYGEWGSRKYLMNSLNQSLKRMNLDYVDIFYSHRYDPETPLEETLQALVDIVRQGKACMWVFPNTRKKQPNSHTAIWRREMCTACSIREDTICSTGNRKKKVFCNRHAKTVPVSLPFHRWHKAC